MDPLTRREGGRVGMTERERHEWMNLLARCHGDQEPYDLDAEDRAELARRAAEPVDLPEWDDEHIDQQARAESRTGVIGGRYGRQQGASE